MKAFEYFEVECEDAVGAESYRRIAGDILGDLDLIKVIGRLHIFIDPKVPLFLAVGLTRKLPRRVRLRDFANVLEKGDGVLIDISDETHLSRLLHILWERFGRDLVEQPDRWTIQIRGGAVDPSDIEDLIVFDPTESLAKDIIYAFQYIAPEGFKVRRQLVKEGRFYYVASENTLEEGEVDRLLAENFAKIGVNE
ncbi:MAG: methanogenesis marker 17 protein [Methanomicrobiaceae archaeon]|nr:methanogenesis marker 17 protein [Methanomicrobiaceae archaeon]